MIKLSVTTKLDGIKSWSLQALNTCPGAINYSGTLVDSCKGCYATTGNYVFKRVKELRGYNKKTWKDKNWTNAMIFSIQDGRYFRWFDSGDMYSLELARKIYEVMKGTPETKHWLPTKMHKFKKFEEILKKMESLPNVVVRRSSDSINGEFSELHGSTIIESLENVPSGVKPCLSSLNDGKCNGCRDCWNKEIPVIGYVPHGKKMAKIIRISKAA